MRVRLSIAAVVVSAAVIAGCARPGSREAKKLIERDTGKLIEMRIGNSILVELPGNPTTGYTWEVSSIDPLILHKLGDSKFSTNSNVIGSPGKMALRFKVVGEGKTTLVLAYRRSWEKNVAPVKTFSVNVVAVK